MNDLEPDLRELLRRKAVEGSTASRPPERVVRRSRHRQLGLMAVSALTVIVIIGIAAAGFGAAGHDRNGVAPEPAQPRPSGSDRADDVVTTAGNDPVPWTLTLSGSVADGNACIDFDTEADFVPLCPPELPTDEPMVRIWSDSGQLFAVGSAPPGVLTVRFEGSGGAPSNGVCIPGPDRWNGLEGFEVPLPDLDDGRLVFTTSTGPRSITLDRATRQLPWNNESGTITATGQSGIWRVEQRFYREGVHVDVGGQARSIEQPALDDPVVLPYPSSIGAVVLVLTDTSVDEVAVASQGRWFGRWMPSSTKDGDEARLWVLELPGLGSGTLAYDGKEVGPITWP